jgi:hypothetical protein
VLNGRIVCKYRIIVIKKEAVIVYFIIISWHLSRGNDGNNDVSMRTVGAANEI